MATLEILDRENWEGFLKAEAAVLLVGKSDCAACGQWSEELSAFAADNPEWKDVRFGKVLLDTPGLVGFKRASPWISELDSLPYTAIYQGGEKRAGFMGGGAARLEARLRRVLRGEGG